jgi:uncharacterized protein
MQKTIEVELSPEEAFEEALFIPAIFKRLHLSNDGSIGIRPLRRSIDARGRNITVKFLVEIVDSNQYLQHKKVREYKDVRNAKQIIIVGAGPAGMFAALRLIELGLKPIILERGKDVKTRRRDIAAINKAHVVNENSNYCFGEGGAGTYSDGKLYTRSKKRGDIKRILEILVEHGANPEILYDSHPHIGTNKLPILVSKLKETILQYGGEIYFNTRVVDFQLVRTNLTGAITEDGNLIKGDSLILATGHSARDVYELLHKKNILLEAKPFAIGVRVEHQQSLIDKIQYHCESRGDYLPASSYSLVHQAKIAGAERGVFSFCMCPGGFIVPAATKAGEIVVNGMSPSRRDSKYSNSGIVVAVDQADFKQYAASGVLAGMHFQAAIEQKACAVAGMSQIAPAQRLQDFTEGRASKSLLETSYQPGLTNVDMSTIFPPFLTDALRQGFKNFGGKMKGYLTNDAQIIGVESRTSSPVRIPRVKETFEHPQVKRLFPCGEGAGYAGGIVSAAMDGERCAESVFNIYGN